MYDLIGVTHHFGRMGGGHYIATAYNSLKERWLKFDDEKVSYASGESDVKNSSAYVLFYQKRSNNH